VDTPERGGAIYGRCCQHGPLWWESDAGHTILVSGQRRVRHIHITFPRAPLPYSYSFISATYSVCTSSTLAIWSRHSTPIAEKSVLPHLVSELIVSDNDTNEPLVHSLHRASEYDGGDAYPSACMNIHMYNSWTIVKEFWHQRQGLLAHNSPIEPLGYITINVTKASQNNRDQ
jgi:hypothetical protein